LRGEKSGQNGKKSGMHGEKSGKNGEKYCMDTSTLLHSSKYGIDLNAVLFQAAVSAQTSRLQRCQRLSHGLLFAHQLLSVI
jgi:hypothetical protein